ncbi:hypothetical protein LguiA_008061 [Lonicera macranthoides]
MYKRDWKAGDEILRNKLTYPSAWFFSSIPVRSTTFLSASFHPFIFSINSIFLP